VEIIKISCIANSDLYMALKNHIVYLRVMLIRPMELGAAEEMIALEYLDNNAKGTGSNYPSASPPLQTLPLSHSNEDEYEQRRFRLAAMPVGKAMMFDIKITCHSFLTCLQPELTHVQKMKC
jgi:hypothetical protein